MNKRSAITVALGLVAALVIGGVGFTTGMTGPAPSLASVRHPAPKVRTIHRTVTVHRPAAAPAGSVVGTAAAPSTSAAQGGDEDEAFEDEGFEDEGHGDGEDQDGSGSEDEGHGGEDD